MLETSSSFPDFRDWLLKIKLTVERVCISGTGQRRARPKLLSRGQLGWGDVLKIRFLRLD